VSGFAFWAMPDVRYSVLFFWQMYAEAINAVPGKRDIPKFLRKTTSFGSIETRHRWRAFSLLNKIYLGNVE
jgi:hypothetical protein